MAPFFESSPVNGAIFRVSSEILFARELDTAGPRGLFHPGFSLETRAGQRQAQSSMSSQKDEADSAPA